MPAEMASGGESGPFHTRRRSPSDGAASLVAPSLSPSQSFGGLRDKLGLRGIARRTLGITFLLITVFLWTLSNFLASYIFSDNTYSKPFFIVYVNTSIFAVSLIPTAIKYVMQHGLSGARARVLEVWRHRRYPVSLSKTHGRNEDRGDDAAANERLLADEEDGLTAAQDESSSITAESPVREKGDKLSLQETAWLSLEFCLLWFLANYFAAACLEYTSVSSVTILTSTSSIWTLVFCALSRIERFTLRKLGGVLASLAGVALISTVDLSGRSDEDRGSFPHKSQFQIALGDSMALLSAVIYGVYVTVMKRRVGDEGRVDMTLFFGLVGLFNLLLLWPVFFIMHFTGLETFEMPPTGKVWTIIMVNAISSFVSDISWAYALLLTTPLLVTVGLSLTIPLSLIGEIFQYAQYSSWVYWVGAGVVFFSFVFINHESPEEGPKATGTPELAAPLSEP